MALMFSNGTNARVWVAIAYSSPGCDGQDWAKKGWWAIDPGGTATVRGGASNGAKYFWYAETADGRRWSGDFFTQLPTRAFDWCWNTGSTDSTVRGMSKLVVPVLSVNHTIVLRS